MTGLSRLRLVVCLAALVALLPVACGEGPTQVASPASIVTSEPTPVPPLSPCRYSVARVCTLPGGRGWGADTRSRALPV